MYYIFTKYFLALWVDFHFSAVSGQTAYFCSNIVQLFFFLFLLTSVFQNIKCILNVHEGEDELAAFIEFPHRAALSRQPSPLRSTDI